MEKLKINSKYLVFFLCLVILVLAGSYVVYITYLPAGDTHRNQSQDLQQTTGIPVLAQPTSPAAVSAAGSTQDSGSPRCDSPPVVDSQIPVPANISVAIRDLVPGTRYSLGENDSGKTIVLATGDIVEINLRWIPGLGFHWVIPVSGCGLELVNAGTYSDGGDIWNTTGHYVVRYRAVSPGTSSIDGKFILVHEEKGDLGFNLTVIVK